MQDLEILQQKLRQLLNAYSALKADHAVLQQKLDNMDARLREQKNKIDEQTQALQRKSLIDAAHHVEDQEKLKQNLDAIIQLIDQYIAKL